MPPVDDTLSMLLLYSVVIALGFLVAVAFYESLCSRDVLVGRVMRSVRRRTERRRWIALAYGLSVFVAIPLLVIAWTVVLEITLVCVGSVQRLGNVALVAASIVAAARILAYIREKTAHELAKAIPLSLAIILLTGGVLNLEANIRLLSERSDPSDLTLGMIAFLVVLEIGLRLTTDASQWTLREIRRRRGIDDHTGVWRTLWAGVRRPMRA
jgi:MFS family permease